MATKRILVVTDDDRFLRLLGGLASHSRYSLILSPANYQAAELAAIEAADLVLVDATREDSAALDVVDLMKLGDQTARVPVLICAKQVGNLRATEKKLGHNDVQIISERCGPGGLLKTVQETVGGPSNP